MKVHVYIHFRAANRFREAFWCKYKPHVRSERWSQTSNTFYEKAMKTYVRSTFGTTIFHFTPLLTPSLYTVHTRQDGRIRSHQRPFVIWAPKPASVRWDCCESPSAPICSDYSEMSHYWKPGGGLQSPCPFGGETGSSCSQRVSVGVSGSGSSHRSGLAPGVKRGPGAVSQHLRSVLCSPHLKRDMPPPPLAVVCVLSGVSLLWVLFCLSGLNIFGGALRLFGAMSECPHLSVWSLQRGCPHMETRLEDGQQ